MKNRRAEDCHVPMVVRFVGVLFLAVLLAACAASSKVVGRAETHPADDLESQWGVRLAGIRMAAAGHLVDFRYKVTDAQKAANLMRRGDAAFLIDAATGTKLPVPVTKVGQLRGTGTLPQEGRVYAVMFGTGAGLIHRGSSVTVVIGDFRAENLTVE